MKELCVYCQENYVERTMDDCCPVCWTAYLKQIDKDKK